MSSSFALTLHFQEDRGSNFENAGKYTDFFIESFIHISARYVATGE